MIIEEQFKTILWDFDGVIMNSNEVRDRGFAEVLKTFPKEQVAELLSFHKKNGGLSRYVKFRHFFEKIRDEKVTESQIREFTDKFSIIMLESLLDPNLLIEDTMHYITKWHKNINMHIVSGSDQKELRFICKSLAIDVYFKTIHGSPTTKIDLVEGVIKEFNYKPSACILIGDSFNDFDAAKSNSIYFAGFNNFDLKKLNSMYIDKFNV